MLCAHMGELRPMGVGAYWVAMMFAVTPRRKEKDLEKIDALQVEMVKHLTNE